MPIFLRSLLLSALPFGAAAPAAVLPADHAEVFAVPLDPVVVTTTVTHQPLLLALDPKAPMQPIPAQDGAQVLQHVPGFAVIRKGGTDGDPVLRGMAGSRLGILVDGEGLLGGCGQRMDPPTAYVFPAAFDRVTIVKGPQTVLYGPGNTAGIVRFERDTVRLAAAGGTLHSTATTGSFGRFDAAMDARLGTPQAHARLAATFSRADDSEDGDGRALHSSYRRWSIQPAAVWTPDAATTVELTAARSDGEAAYADRAMDGVAFDRENVGLRFRRATLTPLLASVELQVFHNAIDHVMDNFSLRSFVPTPMMPGRAVSNPDRITTGGRLEISLTPERPARVTVGIDHQTNRHRLRMTSDDAAMPYKSRPRQRDAVFHQTGVYAEMRQPFDDDERRRLVAGARVDDWSARDERSVVSLGMGRTMPNPTAGQRRSRTLPAGFLRYEHDLSRAPDAAPVTLYAGLGHAERFPDYWELFSKESADSLSAFGRDPEASTQFDAGVLYRSTRFDASLSLFASSVDNYILVESGVMKPAAMGGLRSVTISRNIDATTRGGEASFGWRMTEQWKLDGSLAAVHGENDTDHRPLAQLPPLEGRLSLTYLRPTWSATALWRGVAAQDRVAPGQGNIVGQDLGPSPGFAVFSLNASWRPLAWLRVSAGVDNLFDRTYAEHISRAGAMIAGFEQTTRVNEPGRFLWLKVDVNR